MNAPMNRRQWCAQVAVLCAPGMAEKAAAALSLMLPALQHLPDYLFTADTAQEVASRKHAVAPGSQRNGERRTVDFVPAWDEITRALNVYRSQFIHEPRKALAAPVPAGREAPTEAEKAAVADILAGWKRERAVSRAPDADDGRPALRPWKPETDGMSASQRLAWRRARGLKIVEPQTRELYSRAAVGEPTQSDPLDEYVL